MSAAANSPADRNLLFGILALQMDFITRDHLIGAMNAWVLEKTKPLGLVLVALKHLAEDERVVLDALVEKHLARHHDDPQQSLAAVNPLESAIEMGLAGLQDAEIHASIAAIPGRADEPIDPQSTMAFREVAANNRFQILRPHAEGGLGRVSVALDGELNREVALKEIKDRHAENADSRARFLLEAEITGGLEHPGIVPVYSLGAYANGRPFYAMRFIRGDSLKDAIAQFHGKDEQPASFHSLEFRQLLGRFIAVCNAVAYAHSRGVLHRDLKPANIMLGKYGETLVVDWGLAKAGGRGQESVSRDKGSGKSSRHKGNEGMAEPPLRPASANSAQETIAGKAFGTPAYMSPEQAEGRLDLLGPASDVYSLGATLFALLLNRPPVDGKDTAEVLKKVRKGEIDWPSRMGAETVPESSQVQDPDGAARPDRLVPPALLAICKKAMAFKAPDRYTTPLALAEDIEHWLADEPVGAWAEPVLVKWGRWTRRHKALVSGAAAALVVGVIATATGIVWHREEQHRQETAETVRQAQADRQLALAQATVRGNLVQADEAYNEILKTMKLPGGIQEFLNQPTRSELLLGKARASWRAAQASGALAEGKLGQELMLQFDNLDVLLASVEADYQFARRLEYLRQIAPTFGAEEKSLAAKLVIEYERAFADGGIDKLTEDRAAAVAKCQSSRIKEQLVAALDAWAVAAFAADKAPLAETLMDVVRQTASDPTWGDRLRKVAAWHDQKALAELAEQAPAEGLLPEIGSLLLGNLLAEGTDLQVSWLRSAQGRFPADFWLNLRLADALQKSRPTEAIVYYRMALTIRPTSSVAWNNLGRTHFERKELFDVGAAVTAFRRAIECDPKNARAYHDLGVARLEQKKPVEAFDAFKTSLEFDPRYTPLFTKFKAFLPFDDKGPGAYLNLGNDLHAQGRFVEASAAYEMAITRDPDNATIHNLLAMPLISMGKFAEAVAACERALELDSKSALAYNNLGTAKMGQKKLFQAVAALEKAIELNSTFAMAFSNLAAARYELKQWPEAVDAGEKATRLDPNLAIAFNNLGMAYYAQKQIPQAVDACQKAIKLNPNLAVAYNNLGMALRAHKRLPDAIAAYRKAIELDPRLAEAYSNLAAELRDAGDHRGAVQACEKALQLLAPDHPNRGALQQLLQQCQKLIDAKDR